MKVLRSLPAAWSLYDAIGPQSLLTAPKKHCNWACSGIALAAMNGLGVVGMSKKVLKEDC